MLRLRSSLAAALLTGFLNILILCCQRALDGAHAAYDNASGRGENGVQSSADALAQKLSPLSYNGTMPVSIWTSRQHVHIGRQ